MLQSADFHNSVVQKVLFQMKRKLITVLCPAHKKMFLLAHVKIDIKHFVTAKGVRVEEAGGRIQATPGFAENEIFFFKK